MKTAQEIYSILKKEHNPLVALQSSEWYDHYQLACVKAYDHTFSKGYNPEAMDEMAIGMAEVIKILHKEGRVNLSTALQSILEKAKLK